MEKNALIIVDVQYDFCPEGNLAVADGEKIIPTINKLMASNRFDTIIATQDWHPSDHISFASNHSGKKPFDVIQVSYGDQMLWPRHCVQNTSGAMLHGKLDTEKINFIMRKGMNKDIDSYSAFKENDKKTLTGLHMLLDPILYDNVYIVGIATDVCVYNTAVDAVECGLKTFVFQDACAGVTPDGTKKAIEKMKEAGITIVYSGDFLKKGLEE